PRRHHRRPPRRRDPRGYRGLNKENAMHRLSLSAALVLAVCFAVLPAVGGDPPKPAPAEVKSDYVLYAHLNVKAVRESAVFTELKEALAKNNAAKLIDELLSEESRQLGIQPFDLDSVTLVVPEIPPRDDPKFIVILVS